MVQEEDYDAAEQIKAEIDRMRHSLGNAPPPRLQVLLFSSSSSLLVELPLTCPKVLHDDGGHMHGGEVTRRANRPHTKDPFERAPMSSRHAAHHQSPPQQQQQQYSPRQQQQRRQQRHWEKDGGLRSSFDEQLPSVYSDLRSDLIPEGQVRFTACRGRHISRDSVSSPPPPLAPSCRPCEPSNEKALLLLLLLPLLQLMLPLLKLSVNARLSKTAELKLSGSRRLNRIAKLLPLSRCARVVRASSFDHSTATSSNPNS